MGARSGNALPNGAPHEQLPAALQAVACMRESLARSLALAVAACSAGAAALGQQQWRTVCPILHRIPPHLPPPAPPPPAPTTSMHLLLRCSNQGGIKTALSGKSSENVGRVLGAQAGAGRQLRGPRT